jgi:hypothetical protein
MDFTVGAILFLHKTNEHIGSLKYTLVRCPDWYQHIDYWVYHDVLDMETIWTQNIEHTCIMIWIHVRTRLATHKKIQKPIILGFQMDVHVLK